MRAIITGLNGTVAPALAQVLRGTGHTVIPWNRAEVSPDDTSAARAFIQRTQPDCFFHLATGSPAWVELAAQVCAAQNIKFLFTSSVSVFSAAQVGPFSVEVPPQPEDDYGRYKLECEQRVRTANPQALVVRLGWQIGTALGGNHMVDYLERTFRTQGQIEASVNWYQACSFLEDTATGLQHCMETLPAGLYHLDGNPGLNFYEIVSKLNQQRGGRWVVRESSTPALNNRLIDSRLPVTPITYRF